MATAQDIIKSAMRTLGVMSPTQTQLDNALTTLNEMLDGWSSERLLIPFLKEESFVLTIGTAVYTIGSGGNFNTVRPEKIESAFVRDSVNIDYPINPIISLEDYNRVSDKSKKARPDRIYYAPEFPLGKIQLDPNPDAAYTLKLFSWKALSSFATLSTSASMPGHYTQAMRLSLAVTLAPEFSVALHPAVTELAVGAHLTIRNLNKPPVSSARYDPAILMSLQR